MSEYQQRKARALELQRVKEAELKRELAARADQEKQVAKIEDEKRKQREAAAKEARRLELVRANEALQRRSDGEADKAKDGEWDPFAEDQRRPPPASTSILNKPKPKTSNETRSTTRAGPSKTHADPSSSTTKPYTRPRPHSKDRDDSPPPLGRKEKAAKLFAQKAKKASNADSVFSVRALVEGSSGSHSSSPRISPAPSTIKPAPRQTSGVVNNGSDSRSHGHSRAGIKDRIKKDLAGASIRKLCPDRETRDRRTIDEIQKDIIARRTGTVPRAKSTSPSGAVDKPPKAKPKPPPIPSTARPAQSARPDPSDSSRRRARSFSASSASTTSSSNPPRKKYREKSPEHDMNASRVSAEIQAFFRRPGRAPPRRFADSDSEGSSDMEAGLSDVEAEERRTAAIARREDEMAEREEKERKAAKERAKREREREIGKMKMK